MTINDVITEVDSQKPNQYTDADKIKWISVCEGKIIDTIFNTHEGTDVIGFVGYTINDIGEELLVPDTYADVYKYYVYAMIDAMNGELQRYTGSMQLFNAALKDYGDKFNREHMPKSMPLKVF
jgi:hypothetical protein